jgi:uncharacterized phage-associated protein
MKMLLEFDYKKATQAINFLSKKEGGQIDKLKLIKLIYFADRYHLRRYGRPVVNDAYLAMTYGPVGSSVKDIAELSDFLDDTERAYASTYLKRGDTPHKVVSIADVDSDIFSQSELEALEFAYKEFGNKSASILVNLTHMYPEWDKFKNAFQSGETTRETMSYTDFFRDPDNARGDKFVLSDDILTASRQLFEEDYKVAESWK